MLPAVIFWILFLLNTFFPMALETSSFLRKFSARRIYGKFDDIDIDEGDFDRIYLSNLKTPGSTWVFSELTKPILYMFFNFLRILIAFYCPGVLSLDEACMNMLKGYIILVVIKKICNRLPFDLYYWPRFIFPVQPTYSRKSTITEVITRPKSKTTDYRQQAQKSFEKTEDSTLGVFTEEFTKTYYFGYYDEGRFVIVDQYVRDTKTQTATCELELVCQMFSSRNMCATVSTEALIERMANSTNLAPHVNHYRNDHLSMDVYNDSYRLATYITLFHRMNRSKSIDDQLFWTGNAVGLMRTREY
jgi:hypothetical protein